MGNRLFPAGAALLLAGVAVLLYRQFVPGRQDHPLSLDAPQIVKSLSSNRSKVMLVAVDGATWRIARPLIEKGRMPNLKRMVDTGPHGVLRSEPPYISPALWTTVATGRSRADHGMDNFFAKLPGSYEQVRVGGSFRKVPALWEMAERAGRSVGIINWNPFRPAEEVNGVFVAYGAGRENLNEGMVFPEAWRERLASLQIGEVAWMEEALNSTRESSPRFAYEQDLFVYTVTREILERERPDLVMAYFPGVDVVSHLYWEKGRGPQDSDGGLNTPRGNSNGWVIENHYVFVDELLGGLVEQAAGYTVIVISDHGMGPNSAPRNHYLYVDRLLEAMGYLAYEEISCEMLMAGMIRRGRVLAPVGPLEGALTICGAIRAENRKRSGAKTTLLTGAEIEKWLAGQDFLADRQDGRPVSQDVMQSLAEAAAVAPGASDIEWSSTRLFGMQDLRKIDRAVFINVKEREREGVIDGKAYEPFRQHVLETLRGLTTESGKPLFLSVQKGAVGEEIVEEGDADVPDLLFRVNRPALLDRLIFRGKDDADPIPMAHVRWIYSSGTGDHVPDGIAIFAGEGTAPSVELEPVSLYDVAPTVLWHLGLPRDELQPGRVLRSAFAQPLADRELFTISSWADFLEKKRVLAIPEIEQEEVEQLRALGYVQ